METSQHIAALRREGTLLAEAAARTSPDAPVPTCPEWRLRDLVRHTGQVHRWATAYVTQGRREPFTEAEERAFWGPGPADTELVDWFKHGHAALVDALEGAPADLDCFTFLPAPSPRAFWARRQMHETAVHRVDAELAAGLPPTAIAPEPAEDGLAELLTGFMTRRRVRVRSERPRTMLVRPTDRPASWLLRITQDPLQVGTGGAADCTVSGTAQDLYLLLWNRRPLDAVTVTGDRAVAELWRETAHVR